MRGHQCNCVLQTHLVFLLILEKDSEMIDSTEKDPVQDFTTSQRKDTVGVKENIAEAAAPIGRRGRFAHLAQTMSNWEDDLSHPIIQ